MPENLSCVSETCLCQLHLAPSCIKSGVESRVLQGGASQSHLPAAAGFLSFLWTHHVRRKSVSTEVGMAEVPTLSENGGVLDYFDLVYLISIWKRKWDSNPPVCLGD